MRTQTKVLLLCIILALWAVQASGADTHSMKISLSIPNSAPELSATNTTQTISKGDAIQPITITATKGDWISWSNNLPQDWNTTISEDSKSYTITPPNSLALHSQSHSYTVQAQNSSGSSTQTISITVQGSSVNPSLIASDHAFIGSPQVPLTSTTPSGHSSTSTQTTFSDIHDRFMLSADIALTSTSSDFIGFVNSPFSQTFSVDVTLQLKDTDYNIYDYSLNIDNLPNWLSPSGQLVSKDNNLAPELSKHHHEFILSGTPTAISDPTEVVFTATVNVSGDTPIMRATGSKSIKFAAVNPALISLDALLACEPLTLYSGNSGSISPNLTVKGKYSNGNIKTLAADEYSAQWSTTSPGIEGISLSNGTLNVDSSVMTGTYNVPVFVLVKSGNLEASAEISVKITVNDITPSGISASPTETEVTAGQELNVIVTLTDGTNILWSISGELPKGVSVSSNNKTLTVSGTTSLEDVGQDFTLTATAKNNAGELTTTFTIKVADVAPELTSETFSAVAYKGETFSLSIMANAGTNLVWNWSGVLPSGLSSSSSNNSFTVSGIPNTGTRGAYGLTLEASNSKGTAQAALNIDVKGRSYSDHEEDIDTGISAEPCVSVDSVGRSITSTQTVFRNGGGAATSSIDIAITADSTDLAAAIGVNFAKTISVDVTVLLNDSDYGIYAYSLDVEGLPDWLEISGEVVSSDENLAEGITVYHHEIELSGMPQTDSENADVVFIASVKISGDSPVLNAVGSKDVNVSVREVEPDGISVDNSDVRALPGEAVNVNVALKSGTNVVWGISGELPSGFRVTSTDKALSIHGTASESDAGKTFTLTAIAANSAGSKNTTIKLTVLDIAPALSDSSVKWECRVGEKFSRAISATGTNLVWRYSGSLPNGLAASSNDQSFSVSGTPAPDSTGSYSLNVTASNSTATASTAISLTVYELSSDIQLTQSSTRTITDQNGKSITSTLTTFSDNSGSILASIDVAISSESTDFSATNGLTFSQIFTVDTAISLEIDDFSHYSYSLDIHGLPEWLKPYGEILSNDNTVKAAYHHAFTLSGTPSDSASANVVFIVTVSVSGDNSFLEALASKDVRVSVNSSSSQNNSEPNSVPSYGNNSQTEAQTPAQENDAQPETQTPSSENIVPPPHTDSYLATGEINSLGQELSLADIAQSMTHEERNAVTTLKVDGNVNDLSGLENFPNLERIDLSEATSLKSIAITDASPVIQFYAPGNSSLRSVNLSSSNVVYVDVSRCSALEELNASYCYALLRLECQDCSLRTLNITASNSLEYIDCSRNSLNVLDAGSYQSLKSLYCYNQQYVSAISQQELILDGLAVASSALGLECVSNIMAWDFDGREISADYDAMSGQVVFGSVPAKFAYDYYTGFKDVNMDVTVFSPSLYDGERTSYEPQHNTGSSASGSSGGCVAATIPLCALALVLLLKR